MNSILSLIIKELTILFVMAKVFTQQRSFSYKQLKMTISDNMDIVIHKKGIYVLFYDWVYISEIMTSLEWYISISNEYECQVFWLSKYLVTVKKMTT